MKLDQHIAVIKIPDMKKQEMLKEFSLNILQWVFKIHINLSRQDSKLTRQALHQESNNPCVIILENYHNHPTQSLEATSFKDLTDLVKEKINSLFELGMSPSLVCKEFLQSLRKDCDDELMFHK